MVCWGSAHSMALGHDEANLVSGRKHKANRCKHALGLFCVTMWAEVVAFLVQQQLVQL